MNLLILILMVFGWSGEQPSHSPDQLSLGHSQDSLKVENLEIADGFLFRNYKTVQLELQLLNETQQPLGNHSYRIYSLDHAGEKDLMSSGRSKADGRINTYLEVPLHITTLLIEREEKRLDGPSNYQPAYKKDLMKLTLDEALF